MQTLVTPCAHAGTLDVNTNKWTGVTSPNGLFCSGHTATADGRIAIVGGHREVGKCLELFLFLKMACFVAITLLLQMGRLSLWDATGGLAGPA